MKVFRLEKIKFRNRNPLKIEDCLSKKNMDGCPSIIEVNGVYYGIEKHYYRYSPMEARGIHYSNTKLKIILLRFILSGSVESCNISTRRSSSPFPNMSNFLLPPPTSYNIKNQEKR